MQRQWCSQETRKPPEGISAAKRLDSIACCDGKAIPIYSNTSRKLSAGRSTLCVRTAEFFLKQKAHRTAIRCAFCIAYYTIPRAIRELWRHIRWFIHRWHYTIPRAIRELWPDCATVGSIWYYTIPRAIRELWQNAYTLVSVVDYTIPRAIRELWQTWIREASKRNYTIPRAIRELWHFERQQVGFSYYTIPRAIRELWRVPWACASPLIIPYQELLGNYD